MPITVDWIGANPNPPYKARVAIPQSYLTWITGALYELKSMQFWADLKSEEWSETGIVFSDIQAHNPDYTVVGVNYADAVFMLCEVEFENTGSPYSVRIAESNNDIFDVENGILVPTPGVTVIPGNSAGLVITDKSGLTTEESQALLNIETDIALMDAKIDLLLTEQELTNEQKMAEHITEVSPDPSTTPGKIILRNTIVTKRWEADAWEDAAGTIGYRKTGLEKAGMLTLVAWS